MKEYRFVLIGDIQFGSSSKKHLENTINLALEQNPDFIVFVGDLVDTNNYSLDDFDIFSKISVPFYFISGNHEYIHQYSKLTDILKEYSQITVLNNQSVSYEGIDIVGVDYRENLSAALENISLHPNQYSILLYHEPKGIDIGVKK